MGELTNGLNIREPDVPFLRGTSSRMEDEVGVADKEESSKGQEEWKDQEKR